MSMSVEELVLALRDLNIIMNRYDNKVIAGFYMEHWVGNLRFTTKQADLALRIIARYQKQLSQALNQDVTQYITNPVYLTQPRTVPTGKTIKTIPDPNLGRVFSVEFPYSDRIVAEIRKIKNEIPLVNWMPVDKIWSFPVSEASVEFLSTLVEYERFEADQEFQDLAAQFADMREQAESHVPMLIQEHGRPRLINVSPHVPELSNRELLPAIFEARQLGITVWDDTIESYLTSNQVNTHTTAFLKTDPDTNSNFNSDNINDLADVLKNLTPILFVIPGGMELEKTRMIYEALSALGFQNKDISVLFRLSSKIGDEFNTYVRDNQLNSAINTHTRAVMISSRFPKTIVKTGIRFNCVIMLGSAIVHYSIQDYIKSHPNLIDVSEINKQGK